MSTLDDYTVEIDETDRQRVVLIVPDLRLIVLGQTRFATTQSPRQCDL